MEPNPGADKTGAALNAQRFKMLEDIAKELGGEIVFPTCFDVVLRLRKVLQDPNQTMDRITAAISVEPLIASKLLTLANSALYNPMGVPIRDLGKAIQRLGLKVVRSTSLSIAMNQMLRAKGMVGMAELAHNLWDHSLNSAAAAYVIARRMTRLNPEEAQLAGLVHDLGAFYMLYRASQYEELRTRPDSIKYLIVQWHESIGMTLMDALGLPEDIVESSRDHDQLRPPPNPIRTLTDVVYVANLIAGGVFEWLFQDMDSASVERHSLGDVYHPLMDEIQERCTEMRAAFA